jgi:phosphoribosylformylglycinamidine synthase
MAPRIGVVLFPGTNCEHDAVLALDRMGADAELVWHGASSLGHFDALVLPGGFAHGDYLRPGAIARFSPVMEAVAAYAAAGGPVVGICNGFQVLTEAGLLPGALLRNAGQRFVCRNVALTVATSQSLFTSGWFKDQRITIPVAHHDGNFYADEATLDRLEGEDRVAFRYAEPVNGSQRQIAGVLNQAGNVLGMMPHPERMIEPAHGGSDGRVLFESVLRAVGVTA